MRWTLQLLADRLVALTRLESLSYEAVRLVLKKRSQTLAAPEMVSETKLPLPMRNGKPGRYDYEYRREGTCNLFMFLQPLAGWRHIKVTDQRTKQDFAWCMKDLVEIHS